MTSAVVARDQIRDAVRSRWALFYLGFFVLVTDGLFRFGGSGERVILSLMNVVILLVPMVSLLVALVQIHGAREYVEMLLTQPVRRSHLFRGLYVGLAAPLLLAFGIGVGAPFVWHGGLAESATSLGLLLLTGSLLTVAFVGIGMFVALGSDDRLRGLGIAVAVWLFFAVVYDGLILIGITMFSHWPVERGALVALMLNPIDLGRVLLILSLDAAALMGYTGAVFQEFAGSALGKTVSVATLGAWGAVPFLLGQRRFTRRDF